MVDPLARRMLDFPPGCAMIAHATSILGDSWPAAAPQNAPVVQLHGDADDHLRLIALLGHALADHVPDRDVARACQCPRATWAERRAAFEELLATTSVGAIRLIDPDALLPAEVPHPTSERDRQLHRWDDAEFGLQREATLACISRAARRIDWWMLRTLPTPRLDEEVGFVEQVEQELPEVDEPRLRAAMAGVAPAVRPILLGLVTHGGADAWTTARLVELTPPEDRTPVVLESGYEALPPSLRSAARHYSTLRGTYPANGSVGPLPAAEGGSAGVRALRDAGWLLQAPGGLFMSWPARRFLQVRARLRDPSQRMESHHQVARALGEGPLGSTLEAHYHAIESQDEARALETAVCYGADLRGLARSLSLAGEYQRSWKLYQRIVDDFDAEDAYAWEYLAYNLDRDGAEAASVLAAYDQAAQLDPQNPLYAGRLLGYRARLGHTVAEAFDRRMQHFQVTGNVTAMGFFAEAVLNGLVAARRFADCRHIAARWAGFMTLNEHLMSKFGRRSWMRAA